MSELDKYKLDNLNATIKNIENNQKKLDSNITNFNLKINELDISIEKLKGEKTIIREIYHEKINSIDNYTNPQLDSFFTNRYHY